jgi:predicted AlkP superfamily pyrophosphatase or phosphodiesterase
MTPVAPERTLILDDYLDLATVQIEDAGSTVCLRPIAGDLAEVERVLAKMPHVKIYRAENLPAHLHLSGNARIAPLWILPEEGWRVETRAVFQRPRRTGPLRGDHGYDPALASMRGIFIAQGPAFKSGVVTEAVENVHIYNLLCAALGLRPAPNDGDDRLVKAALR